MGRTSKFLFPIPTRKSQSNRIPPPPRQQESQPPPTPGLSKAQRILGTDGGLNIDTPREDDQTWRTSKPKSSGMSISISESTDGSDDEEAKHENWDAESGVLRLPPRLREKASSTLLGQHPENEALTDTSSLNSRLRNEGSSSTLRSHYERQKNPLSISQQTSSSSARDLALRKGLNTITGSQRSPLFKVDFVEQTKDSSNTKEDSTLKSPKRKPGRLDLSKLFPKPRQDTVNPTLLPEPLTQSPSALSYISTLSNGYHFPRPGRATPGHTVNAEDEDVLPNPLKIKPQYSLQSLQDPYTNRQKDPTPELPPAIIPQRSSSRNVFPPTRALENLTGPQLAALHTPPPSMDSSISPASKGSQFSWKNVRSSMNGGGSSTAWDSTSAISTSSLNTRTSKKTTNSTFETTDLKNFSVLSLSSDEDSDGSDDDGRLNSIASIPSQSRNRSIPNLEPLKPPAIIERPPTSPAPTPTTSRPPFQRVGTAKIPKSRFQDSQFLSIPVPAPMPVPSIPKPSPVNPRISGPWNMPGDLSISQSHTSAHIQAKIDTPPLSPTSIEFRQAPGRSSRFMAVNKQERALLEALREKRTRMKEDAIQEHYLEEEEEQLKMASTGPTNRWQSSTTSSRQPYRSQSALSLRDRDSKQSTLSGGSRNSVNSRSSGNTLRGGVHSRSQSVSSGSHQPPRHKHKRSASKGDILLFLERSDMDVQTGMQTAEPSPDLTEFYRESFGLGEGYKYYSDDEADEGDPRLMARDPTPREIFRMANRRDTRLDHPRTQQQPRNSNSNLYDGYGYDISDIHEDEYEDEEEPFSDFEDGLGDFSPTRTVPHTTQHQTRLSAVGSGGRNGNIKGRYTNGNEHMLQRQDSLASVEEEAAIAPHIRLRPGQRGHRGSVVLGSDMGFTRNAGSRNGDPGWANENRGQQRAERIKGRNVYEKSLPDIPPLPRRQFSGMGRRGPPVPVSSGSEEWEKEVVVWR